MSVEYISTLEDERLAVYTKLTERELRNKLEPEKGIFIAESAKVIERALNAGITPQSFLLEEKWLDTMAPLLERVERTVPIFVAPMQLMEKLTGYNVTRGALCAMRRPKLVSPQELLSKDISRICVLDGIVDHTNVGAIFRSAAALNVDALFVSPTCCDPLYRRAVRVSMGTVFQVPWSRLCDDVRRWPYSGIETLHEAGFTCAAMALTDNSVSLDDPALASIDKLALFMGTEGHGLSDKVVNNCDMTIRIPMANGVDSLNVAAASSVAFWQLCKHVDNDYHYNKGIYA